jgi:hypothetical protein
MEGKISAQRVQRSIEVHHSEVPGLFASVAMDLAYMKYVIQKHARHRSADNTRVSAARSAAGTDAMNSRCTRFNTSAPCA